eukprot:scaffold23497_cov106-Cylindrotheca_fusiformis.AAC.1
MSSTILADEEDDEPVALGYAVQKIQIGIVSNSIDENNNNDRSMIVAKKLRRLLPDRIRTHRFSKATGWPSIRIDLLVVVCSEEGLNKETAQWIDSSLNKDSDNSSGSNNSSILVWTDFDLERNLEDRQIFYDTLAVAGGLSKVLPRRVLLTPPAVDVFGRKLVEPVADNAAAVTSPTSSSSAAAASEMTTTAGSLTPPKKRFLDRQDQVEINGVILLKPILKRPLDPNDDTVTVYYPRSQGGGAKKLKFLEDTEWNVPNFTAQFDPNIRHVPSKPNQPILYEELLPLSTSSSSSSSSPSRNKERKRDRFKKFMKKLSGNNEEVNSSHFGDDDQVSYESDLSRMDRKIFVVTTASLPWM